MKPITAGGVVRKLARLALGALLLLLVAALVGYGSNLRLPGPPPDPKHLEPVDKMYLSEVLRLRSTYGDAVWPGWAKAPLPLRITNGSYQFLLDHPAPPADWELVTDDDFQGRRYWRRPDPEASAPSEAVRGAEQPREDRMRMNGLPVAYAVTKRAMDRTLIRAFARPIPDPLKPFVPYQPLVQGTEVYLTSVVNSLMQAYLGRLAPQRVASARLAFENIGGYPFAHAAQVQAWPEEVAALIAAAEEPTAGESQAQARRFLEIRARRRAAAQLDAWSLHLEREAEWLKGIAFYAELKVWTLARDASTTPAAELASDGHFRGYQTFDRRWSQVLSVTQSCAARPCPMRFQYTGMLQAFFLDRHMPDWRARALNAETTLESLVAEAAAAD